MELTQNPVSGQEVGTVAPVSDDEGWFLVFEWDEIGYVPETNSDATVGLLRVRYFEVADDELFVKTQGQIVKVIEAMGSKYSRRMYNKRFAHRDGRDWAAVSTYPGWEAVDEQSGDFAATFIKLFGEDGFAKFNEEWDQAIVSREDEYLTPIGN